jgi:hypothetical protein
MLFARLRATNCANRVDGAYQADRSHASEWTPGSVPFPSSLASGREPNWPLHDTGVQVLGWNRPALALGGHSFPAPTLGRRGA